GADAGAGRLDGGQRTRRRPAHRCHRRNARGCPEQVRGVASGMGTVDGGTDGMSKAKPAKRQKDAPVSLQPLGAKEALADLMKVKPEPKKPPKKARGGGRRA